MKIKESLFRSLAALVLAAAMLGASVCAYADEGGSRYEDVQPDDWFYDAVEHCAKYNSPPLSDRGPGAFSNRYGSLWKIVPFLSGSDLHI